MLVVVCVLLLVLLRLSAVIEDGIGLIKVRIGRLRWWIVMVRIVVVVLEMVVMVMLVVVVDLMLLLVHRHRLLAG